MDTVIQVAMLICVILLGFGVFASTMRYRKILSEIESLQFEQQKLSFRLFMIEKKQKSYQETRVS